MISDKEKKKRQHQKELNSLRNKMGDNIVWFESLTNTQKYDLLFRWKKEKKFNKLKKKEKRVIKYRNYGGYLITREVNYYPTNFKYFIIKMKSIIYVDKSKIRESYLEYILKD